MKHSSQKVFALLIAVLLLLTSCSTATLPQASEHTPDAKADQPFDTPPSAPAEPEPEPEPEPTPTTPSTPSSPQETAQKDTKLPVSRMTDEYISALLCQGPSALLGYSDEDRLTILRRGAAIELSKRPQSPQRDSSAILFPYEYHASSDNYSYHVYFYMTKEKTAAPGEPEYLMVQYNMLGKLTGSAILYADEPLTLPSSAVAYFADGNSLDRLNQLLISLNLKDPMAYLREIWATDLLGSHGGVDYYRTRDKKIQGDRESYGLVGLRRAVSAPAVVERVPGTGGHVSVKTGTLPLVVTTPATVAAQPQMLSYLQALSEESGYFMYHHNARDAFADYWQSHMIGAEADRDYYSLAPITDNERYKGTQVDALVILYAPDGAVADIELTTVSAAPIGSAQTLREALMRHITLYERIHVNYSGWLNSFAAVMGYPGTHARELIHEALSEYYVRSQENSVHSVVDFYSLPGENGAELPFWVEYSYYSDRIERVRVGEFRLSDIQI